MMDDGWPEDEWPGDGAGPVQAVCFFDSFAELSGHVDESWEEFRAALDEAGLGASAACRVSLLVDSALECGVAFCPLVDGEGLEGWDVRSDSPLWQLTDDGRGSVSPDALWALFEALLADCLPQIEVNNRDEIAERFAGGERPLLLVTTDGQWLDVPGQSEGGG